MTVAVPRSGEIPSRVSPRMTVNPMCREEIGGELLLQLLEVARLVCALTGGSVLFLIWFNQLKQRLRFLNHESTLLNLLPNHLHNLRSCCPKWFLGSHDGDLTSASQRLCCGASPSPMLTCLWNSTFFSFDFLSKEKFGSCSAVW